jgi:hypothetical protein
MYSLSTSRRIATCPASCSRRSDSGEIGAAIPALALEVLGLWIGNLKPQSRNESIGRCLAPVLNPFRRPAQDADDIAVSENGDRLLDERLVGRG